MFVANSTTLYPDDQEFCFVRSDKNDPTTWMVRPTVGPGVILNLDAQLTGITVDAPGVVPMWTSQGIYSNLNTQMVGLDNFIGPSDAPTSDHDINFGNATGWPGSYTQVIPSNGKTWKKMAGINRRMFCRFTRSPFYTNSVDANGKH